MKKSTKIIIVVSLILIVIIIAYIMTRKNKSGNSIADKYEGKYIYTEGLWQNKDCTSLKSNLTLHDEAGCGTFLVKNGQRIAWNLTGITDDKTVSGNVFEVRLNVPEVDLLAIPPAKR